MTQFVNEDDAGYQAVKEQLWGWAQNFRIPDTTRFRVSCNLRKFHEDNYDVDFRTFIEEAVVVTGESVHAEATTIGEYLRRYWPELADEIIIALQYLEEVESWMKLPSLHSYVSPAEDEPSLNISAYNVNTGSYTGYYSYFDVRGSRKDVQNVKSALTWLFAGFQEHNFLGTIEAKWENRNTLRFTSRKLEKGKEGTCWFDLFGNIGVVPGLTTEKPSNIPGLEISLDKMAALLDTNRVTTFAGKVFIKGFDAMLVLVELKKSEHVCVWHLLVNENGEHICYTDKRLQDIPVLELELKGDMDFGRFRHIVGWYPKFENLTGQKSADYTNFEASKLGKPHSEIVLDCFTLSGGQYITVGSPFALGKQQKPVRGKSLTFYDRQIDWASRQHVVFFDVKDRRAWLANGRSALLHLVRASLHRSKTRYKSFLSLEEAAPTKMGTDAVDFVFQSERNRKLRLFKLKDEIVEKKKVVLTIKDGQTTFESSCATETDVKYHSFEDEVGGLYY